MQLPQELKEEILAHRSNLQLQDYRKKMKSQIEAKLLFPKRRRHGFSSVYYTFHYPGGRLETTVDPDMGLMVTTYNHPNLRTSLNYGIGDHPDPNVYFALEGPEDLVSAKNRTLKMTVRDNGSSLPWEHNMDLQKFYETHYPKSLMQTLTKNVKSSYIWFLGMF